MSNESRSRSYHAEQHRPVGSPARFTEEIRRSRPNADFSVWTPVRVPAGQRVTIIGYSNAGFRGIEVSVRLADGTRLHGVDAGLLDF